MRGEIGRMYFVVMRSNALTNPFASIMSKNCNIKDMML